MGLDFHRVQTKKSDDLNHHIRSYWEDRSTRPKTDEELLQRLLADGFTVSLSAIVQIRKDMNLYRRWDERLGRYRPDSELGRRGRREQKHSAFTEAKLALRLTPSTRRTRMGTRLTKPISTTRYRSLGVPRRRARKMLATLQPVRVQGRVKGVRLLAFTLNLTRACGSHPIWIE